jgi:hypothetical protein
MILRHVCWRSSVTSAFVLLLNGMPEGSSNVSHRTLYTHGVSHACSPEPDRCPYIKFISPHPLLLAWIDVPIELRDKHGSFELISEADLVRTALPVPQIRGAPASAQANSAISARQRMVSGRLGVVAHENAARVSNNNDNSDYVAAI